MKFNPKDKTTLTFKPTHVYHILQSTDQAFTIIWSLSTCCCLQSDLPKMILITLKHLVRFKIEIWYKEEMQSVPIKISKICMHLLRKLVTPSHLSFYQWNFVFTIEECFLSHFSLKQTITTSHSQKATWGCRVLFCHVFVMPKKSSHTKNCFCHRLNNKVKHYLCNLEYCQTQRIYMQGGQMLHTLYIFFSNRVSGM